MKSLWVIQPAQPELAQTLSEEHNVSPIVAQLLINRGLTDPDTIRHFFHSRLSDLPDPLTLPDIAAAIEVLADAIATQKKIVLFGDYDVDGMTGTAILYLFLQQAGATVSFYIPDRQNEGYGLSLEALEKIHQQGCDLLVTIDNGTSAFEELAWAAQHDIQSIVIDHHESPTERPACVALVNPKHPASRYPDKTLCSAGLAFNLVIALRAHLRGKEHRRSCP